MLHKLVERVGDKHEVALVIKAKRAAPHKGGRVDQCRLGRRHEIEIVLFDAILFEQRLAKANTHTREHIHM